MRYKRLTYMCTNNKCNQGCFFNADDKFSTICPHCGSEMILVGTKWTSTEEDERREKMYKQAAKDIELQKIKDASKPTVTCPYCKSTNTVKISGLYKAASIGLFGLFAVPGATKQWTCRDCKSDF